MINFVLIVLALQNILAVWLHWRTLKQYEDLEGDIYELKIMVNRLQRED